MIRNTRRGGEPPTTIVILHTHAAYQARVFGTCGPAIRDAAVESAAARYSNHKLYRWLYLYLWVSTVV